MAGAAVNEVDSTDVDFADVQGLLRFGYGRLTSAAYALVRVKDAAAARAWLRAAPISNAMFVNPPPDTALQVAFTAPGLRALGVPEAVIAGFSLAFRTGMAAIVVRANWVMWEAAHPRIGIGAVRRTKRIWR